MREFPLEGGIYDHQMHPRLRIEDDGKARIPQQHHSSLQVWYEDRRMIVLKEKGHSEYYNQYNPPFKVPTQFHVFSKIGDGVVREIGVFPLNKSKEE
jgi:hypothetical protein